MTPTPTSPFELHLAPLQGYTEVEYRRAWFEVYGPYLGHSVAHLYTYTPFLRVEKGEVWKRGLRDALSPLNQPLADGNPQVVPQIIAGNMAEWNLLTQELKTHGFRRIDINLGCPFPPQVKRGRGAGALLHPEFLREMAEAIAADPTVEYSVKMRAGVTDHTQWRLPLEILSSAPLRHITLHPRIAADQYRGTADLPTFSEFAPHCPLPLIYNGDIASPAQITELRHLYPTLRGIMAGRGLLARPSLFAEYLSGEEWSEATRTSHLLRLHTRYRALLEERIEGGDHQLLTKLRPFWEYLEPAIGRKPWKAIHKAGSLASYDAAVAAIR